MKQRVLFFMALAAAAVAFPAPFVFVLPGFAIALLCRDRAPFALAVPLSLAFWPVVLQVLFAAPVPPRVPVAVAVVASAAVVAWRWERPARPDPFAAALLAAAVLFRLLPAVLHSCASGIDMSYHTFLGRKIAETGLAGTQAPLADDAVRGVPVGFHVLLAATGLDAGAAALWVSVAVYAALTLAVYRSLVAHFSPAAAALAAVAVTFAANRPQSAVRYGVNPLVLAFALVVPAVALWAEGMRDRVRAIPVALLAAGSFLIHPTPAYGAIFLLLPAAAADALPRLTRDRLLRTALTGALIVAAVLPLVIMARAKPLPPDSDAWALKYMERVNRDLVQTSGAAWVGAFLHWIPGELGPQFTIVSGLALAYALGRRRRAAALFGAVYLGMLVMALNVKLWFLPMSILDYPDRMSFFLILPAAPALAAAFEEACAPAAARPGMRRVPAALAAALLALAAYKGKDRYLDIYRDNVLVRADDFAAMEWVRTNTPRDAVVYNLPAAAGLGDAGLWIPAFADRKITHPQGAPLYFMPFTARPTHLYIGSTARERDPAKVLRDAGIAAAAEKAFEKGGAAVYVLREVK